MAATPAMVETPRDTFLLYTMKPNTTASTINRMEIIAVVAFAELAATSTAPLSV